MLLAYISELRKEGTRLSVCTYEYVRTHVLITKPTWITQSNQLKKHIPQLCKMDNNSAGKD